MNTRTRTATTSTAVTGLVDAAGDLLYGTADNTLGKLAIGTAYQTLRVNSGATAPEWVSGGMHLIAETVLGSDTASFDLTSIPATYRHLRLLVALRTDRAAQTNDPVVLSLNNDTTDANYDRQQVVVAGTTVTGEQALAASGSRYICEATAVNSTAGNFNTGEIIIPHYASTSINKVATSNIASWRVRSSGSVRLQFNMVGWASTSAVSRITLTPAIGTNFKTGSAVSLYGIG